MKKLAKILSLMLILSFMLIACGTSTKEAAKPVENAGKSVKEQAIAADFQIVDFDYVKDKAGVRKLNEVVLIDARPDRKYNIATIPGAINIPDTKFEKFYPQLDSLGVTKDTEIIVFCGGYKCVKSLHDAKLLRDKGFKNVKIYLAGMPDWKQHQTYTEISLSDAKKMLGKATFIDARPARQFKKGTIGDSINIPDTKFMKKENQEEFLKLLPQDKNAPIIVYCGGYHCVKSHHVADILVKDYGYKNIHVMAAGLPGWKKAGYSTKGATAGTATVAKGAGSTIPAGSDEGTVDKKWFIENMVNPENRPANVFIVDVRAPSEYDAGHVEGAVNIPVDLIFASDDSGCTVVPPKVDKLTEKGDVIFMCSTGGRAGDMYFELLESCNYPKMNKLHFLDAHVDYSDGKCKIK
jgi:rhodanese-related sulfurtransferase/predicted small secreted protein